MTWLVPPGTILCMPTTPFPAPLKGQPVPALEPVRARTSVDGDSDGHVVQERPVPRVGAV